MLEICENSDMPEYWLFELIPKLILNLTLSQYGTLSQSEESLSSATITQLGSS